MAHLLATVRVIAMTLGRQEFLELRVAFLWPLLRAKKMMMPGNEITSRVG